MTPAEIKALRLSLGWTQKRLAEACGVSIRAVKQWEQGKYHPSGSAQILLQQLKTLG
jgi:putative transcriptional regulator